MKTLKVLPLAALLVSGVWSCTPSGDTPQKTLSNLDPANFADVYRGDTTALYVLKNAAGAEACITNFGGRLVSLMVPNKDGGMTDVVLGFDSIQAYYPENNQTDFGASIGRYANRINQGRFMLDGEEYQLPQNNFGHCLHGGTDMGTMGWQYRVYDAEQTSDSTLVLSIVSPDGDNGFPGTVKATVKYELMSDDGLNVLDIAYSATTDKKTIINMTNHSYFNLGGDYENGVLGDTLFIAADYYTPVDSTYMTLGTLEPVAGTPMDFTTPKTIGRDIAADNEQIRFGNGYDHNWVLNANDNELVPQAALKSPVTGITMYMYTTEPGVQVYCGNFLDGTIKGKGGKAYKQRAGICLETQHYPDSPNKPQWPSTVLEPGDIYESNTSYFFAVEK